MTKIEFIKQLDVALHDQVLDITRKEQIKYYTDYIDTEKKNGRTEKEILDELGDPKLIAKTIIQVTPGEKKVSDDASEIRKSSTEGNTQNEYKREGSESGNAFSNNSEENPYGQNPYSAFGRKGNGLGSGFAVSGFGCVIIAIIFFLIIYLILKFFIGASVLVASGLGALLGIDPLIIIFLIIIAILLFSKRR